MAEPIKHDTLPTVEDTSNAEGAGLDAVAHGGADASAEVPSVDHSDLQQVTDASAQPVAGTAVTVEDVTEAMKDVVDPELGINVVDLGLVYGVHVEPDQSAVIDMTLTSAACPLTDVIMDQTDQALEGLVNGVHINWVWMPPWGPDKITDDGREQLRALGFNV